MRKEIIKNKLIFENLIEFVKKEKDDLQSVILIKILADLATKKHTGYFSSSVLENLLVNISNKYGETLKDKDFNKNSFLHVITTCYLSGGHTRVVERWIDNSPDEENHSVILLNQQKNKIPEKLINAVQAKNGKFINLIEGDYINKALKLRELAQKYEYIILHTHMDDPIPILAFGRKDFTRPVVIFNHADHTFWLGASIADITAELRGFGLELSQKRRQVSNNYSLSIPIDTLAGVKADKLEFREKLGLPADKKIILSMGAAYKYMPYGKYDFVKMALNLLNKDDNIIFIVIGPDKTDKMWNKAVKQSYGRILPIGIIPNSEVKDYINAADLYIESFPIFSFTALLDVAITGIPILSLITDEAPLDVIKNSEIQCKTSKEIIDKSLKILNGEIIYSDNLIKEIIKNHGAEGWRNNLKSLIDRTPKRHTINYFNNEKFPNEILNDYDIFVNNDNKSSKIGENILNFDDFKSLNIKNRLFVLKIYTFYSRVNTRKYYRNLLGLYKRFFKTSSATLHKNT